MKLNTKEEKIIFLTGLLKEINRIYGQNLTQSDNLYFSRQKGETGQYTLTLSGELSSLSERLPKNLMLCNSGHITHFSVKHAKLELLTELYNKVLEAAQPEGALDLTDIFAKFKQEHSNVRVTHDRYKNTEETLKYQRRHSQRESVGYFARILNYIFGEPKSAKFLAKYDFFISSSDTQSSDSDINSTMKKNN